MSMKFKVGDIVRGTRGKLEIVGVVLEEADYDVLIGVLHTNKASLVGHSGEGGIWDDTKWRDKCWYVYKKDVTHASLAYMLRGIDGERKV